MIKRRPGLTFAMCVIGRHPGLRDGAIALGCAAPGAGAADGGAGDRLPGAPPGLLAAERHGAPGVSPATANSASTPSSTTSFRRTQAQYLRYPVSPLRRGNAPATPKRTRSAPTRTAISLDEGVVGPLALSQANRKWRSLGQAHVGVGRCQPPGQRVEVLSPLPGARPHGKQP